MNVKKLVFFKREKISEGGMSKFLLLILMIVLISLFVISCSSERKTGRRKKGVTFKQKITMLFKEDKGTTFKQKIILLFKDEQKAEPETLINVRVQSAEKKQIRPYIETTGTLKADEEVVISSEVDGIVKTVTVEEGSAVERGTLLAEINDIDYALDAKRADAALKQAQANLANVKAEFQRKDALFREELITRQQFDDISTRVALAEADLARSKATLDTSRERLARTRIYSPLRGMVKEKEFPSAIMYAPVLLCFS